jgi:hypothetical protein
MEQSEHKKVKLTFLIFIFRLHFLIVCVRMGKVLVKYFYSFLNVLCLDKIFFVIYIERRILTHMYSQNKND